MKTLNVTVTLQLDVIDDNNGDYVMAVSEAIDVINETLRNSNLNSEPQLMGGNVDSHDITIYSDTDDYLDDEKEDKINEAKEAFQQWCEDDAQAEIESYEKEFDLVVDLDTEINSDGFYLWLYENGLRM